MSDPSGVKPRPIIVSGFSSQALATGIAKELGTRVVAVKRKQFKDKEIQTTIEENIRGHEVVVIASASGDPNKQEKEARLLMRAANRAGARKVSLLLPYMWYGRSDDQWDERASPALVDTIETLRAHCENVIIADPHNYVVTREKFLDAGSPVKSCTPVHFGYPFSVQLKALADAGEIEKDRLMLSHADAGSTKRITRSFRAAVYNTLGLDRNENQDDWPMGLKDRDKQSGKIAYKGFSEEVAGRDIVIFEDMIDSGGTACDLAALLKDHGARGVFLFATNGLFSFDAKKKETATAAVDRINDSLIDRVFVADTYDHRETSPKLSKAIEQSPKIHVIDTTPYLAAIIQALHVDAGEDISDQNSISAILRGRHPDQTGGHKGVVTPVLLKAPTGP